MGVKKIWVLLAALAVVLAACSPRTDSELAALNTMPVKGALSPDFELQSLAGETVRLSDFRGQAVVLNFWATWCAPCRQEMPAFESRYQQYGSDLVILAVNFDESAEAVTAFFDEMALSFDPLLDPGGEIQDLYQVRGYPTSYFVDVEGVIQIIHIGLMTEDQLDGYLLTVGIGADGAEAVE